MTTHEVTLDLDKTLQLPPPTITARQGDTQCGITAMVTDHGAPATLTGYTAKFQAAKPDGTYAEQAAQISGSTVTVELDPQFLAAAGLIRTAYFRFFEGTAEKESTQNMCIRVIHDAEGEAPDLSTSYIPTVDQLVEDATEALNSANTALGNAEEALEDAEAATDSATDAAASANAAANAAQSAIDAMTGNVLRGTVGPSEVVGVDDAYPQVPLGVKVKGATRQNLWVNPTGARNGITVASNDDGSVSISGTATSSGAYIGSENVYTLKPNTQYTVSVDKLASFQGFYVSQHFDDGTSDGGTYFGTSAQGGTTKTFTTADNLRYVRFGLGVQPSTSGTTYSGTYRIMLNEGSEAEPWCPPGLNSVGDDGSVKIVTAGKNLLDIPAAQTVEGYGGPYTFTMDDDGWVSCSKDSDMRAWSYDTANVKMTLPAGEYCASIYFSETSSTQGLRVYTADGTMVCYIMGGSASASQTFALDAPTEVGVIYKLMAARARIQLELGSTATAYEPPSVTTTPIDLDGHALNSLPDGTCDELHIDGGGNVVLEKRVGSATLSSDAGDWKKDSAGSRFSMRISPEAPDTYTPGSVISDALPYRRQWDNSYTGTHIMAAGGATYVSVGTDETAQDIVNVCGGKKLLYTLAKPQTIDLGTITPPTMAAPNVTAYVADDTPTEMELDYVRDINVVVDRLEKKVAGTAATVAINEATR